MTAQKRQCAHCGKDFFYKRFDHWFCSAKCVAAFYRAHPNPEYIHSELPHDKPHTCEECGAPFDVNAYAERGGKRAPKYCSPKCKQKAYRDRGKRTQEQAERRYTRDNFWDGSTSWWENMAREAEERGRREEEQRKRQQQEQRNNQERQQSRTADDWKCNYANAVFLLGLTGTWTQAELKKAYRAKMREWHPDVNKAPNATIMAQRINAAYEYLKR